MRQPRGEVVFKVLLVAIFTVLAGGIVGGLLACAVGLICSAGGGGGGGGGSTQVSAGDPCSSAQNACGQSNTGFWVDNGNGSASCNATTPTNSSCPTPTIGAAGFTAAPSTVGKNGKSTLTWQSSNTTSCTVSGDNGFTSSGGASGSITTGTLSQTTTFTLTCEDGAGGPTASRSVKVVVDPHFQEI